MRFQLISACCKEREEERNADQTGVSVIAPRMKILILQERVQMLISR